MAPRPIRDDCNSPKTPLVLATTRSATAHLSAPQVSRGKQLAIVDGGEGVSLHPLSMAPREVVDEEKLVRAFHAVHCYEKIRCGEPREQRCQTCQRRQLARFLMLLTDRATETNVLLRRTHTLNSRETSERI